MRSGDPSKVTMADAHEALNPIEGKVSGSTHGSAKPTALLPVLEEETSPSMPHLDYTPEELDRIHPSIEAPSEEELLDFSDDRSDSVFQKGLRIASEISKESRAQGRRRRPEAEASQEGTEAGGKGGKGSTATTTPLATSTTTARALATALACSTATARPTTTARPPDALRPPSDRRALRTVGGGVFEEASLQSFYLQPLLRSSPA